MPEHFEVSGGDTYATYEAVPRLQAVKSFQPMRMTNRNRKCREDTKFRVLRLLQSNPKKSQRQIAEAEGISVRGVHYLLNALIENGLATLGILNTVLDKGRCE